jgi:hypothetical protein
MDVHTREKDGVSKDTGSAPPAPAPAGTCPALVAVCATDGAAAADKAVGQTCVETATCGDPARTPASGGDAHASKDRWDPETVFGLIMSALIVFTFTVLCSVLIGCFWFNSYAVRATLATSQADLAACRAEQAAHTEAVAQRLLAIAGALRGVAAAAGV